MASPYATPGPSAHAHRVAHQQLSATEFATHVATGQAYETFRVGYETGKIRLEISNPPGVPDRTATFDVGERCLRPELPLGGPGAAADAQHDRLVQLLRGHATAGKCLALYRVSCETRAGCVAMMGDFLRPQIAADVVGLQAHPGVTAVAFCTPAGALDTKPDCEN